MQRARGFTLIELLVVIAIIGVLASVIMGSINTARSKAEDAAVRSNLAGARGQAELFHDVGSSFEGVCNNDAGINGVKTIYMAVAEAVYTTGGSTVGNGPTTAFTGTCNDDVLGWAAEAALRLDGYYCVDNTGNATTSPVPLLDAGEMVCE